MLASSDIGTTDTTSKSVNDKLHTVKITGHLTFDSRHQHFRTAFKEFIEKEGLQIQVTDMVNTDLPSMELGVKMSVTTDFVNFSSQRYAEAGKQSNNIVNAKVVKLPVEKPVEKPARIKKAPVNPETGSDLGFY